MKILIVGLVGNEQLLRLREEGEKRGHTVDGCYTSSLVTMADKDKFEVSLRGEDITKYDLIYLWALGKRRWEWFVAAKFLNSRYGTKIINHKVIDSSSDYYLSPAIDYMIQGRNGIPYPKSAIMFNAKSVNSVVGNFKFPLILKKTGGSKGIGVHKLDSTEKVKEKIKEMKGDAASFVIREFIENDGDIRIFTVGYKAIGAMKRTPPKGDFRSNISQGGSGEEFDLKSNPEIKTLAEKLSKLMATEIAGVDIILDKKTGKPYVLEINPGPQFMGLEKYTSVNAALEIIKYFEKLQSP